MAFLNEKGARQGFLPFSIFAFASSLYTNYFLSLFITRWHCLFFLIFLISFPSLFLPLFFRAALFLILLSVFAFSLFFLSLFHRVRFFSLRLRLLHPLRFVVSRSREEIFFRTLKRFNTTPDLSIASNDLAGLCTWRLADSLGKVPSLFKGTCNRSILHWILIGSII